MLAVNVTKHRIEKFIEWTTTRVLNLSKKYFQIFSKDMKLNFVENLLQNEIFMRSQLQ